MQLEKQTGKPGTTLTMSWLIQSPRESLVVLTQLWLFFVLFYSAVTMWYLLLTLLQTASA